MGAKNGCLQTPYLLCSTPRYCSDCASFSKQSARFQGTHVTPSNSNTRECAQRSATGFTPTICGCLSLCQSTYTRLMQLKIPVATKNCGWRVQPRTLGNVCLGGDGKVNVRRDIREMRSVCPSIYLHPITLRISTSREQTQKTDLR